MKNITEFFKFYFTIVWRYDWLWDRAYSNTFPNVLCWRLRVYPKHQIERKWEIILPRWMQCIQEFNAREKGITPMQLWEQGHQPISHDELIIGEPFWYFYGGFKWGEEWNEYVITETDIAQLAIYPKHIQLQYTRIPNRS